MELAEECEIIKIFIEESKEHISSIKEDLLTINDSEETINIILFNKIYRAVRSIKGGAGFLKFKNILENANYMEEALNKIRNQNLYYSRDVLSNLIDLSNNLNIKIIELENDIFVEVKTKNEKSKNINKMTAVYKRNDIKELNNTNSEIINNIKFLTDDIISKQGKLMEYIITDKKDDAINCLNSLIEITSKLKHLLK